MKNIEKLYLIKQAEDANKLGFLDELKALYKGLDNRTRDTLTYGAGGGLLGTAIGGATGGFKGAIGGGLIGTAVGGATGNLAGDKINEYVLNALYQNSKNKNKENTSSILENPNAVAALEGVSSAVTKPYTAAVGALGGGTSGYLLGNLLKKKLLGRTVGTVAGALGGGYGAYQSHELLSDYAADKLAEAEIKRRTAH